MDNENKTQPEIEIKTEEHVMSFKVPDKLLTDHHCVFRLHSKEFLLNLILKYDLNPNSVYECRGRYYPNVNAIIVSLEKDNLAVKNTFEENKID